MAEVIAFINQYPHLFHEDEDWFMANWHVMCAFEQIALGVIKHGRKHYSARTILEVLRHETSLRGQQDSFKLNNNNAPDLARAFAVLHPEHVDFWEYRRNNHLVFKEAILELANLTFLK